ASTSGTLQRCALPRTVSLQASKLARGVSTPPAPIDAALCGLPAQLTISTASARNQSTIHGSDADRVMASIPAFNGLTASGGAPDADSSLVASTGLVSLFPT